MDSIAAMQLAANRTLTCDATTSAAVTPIETFRYTVSWDSNGTPTTRIQRLIGGQDSGWTTPTTITGSSIMSAPSISASGLTCSGAAYGYGSYACHYGVVSVNVAITPNLVTKQLLYTMTGSMNIRIAVIGLGLETNTCSSSVTL